MSDRSKTRRNTFQQVLEQKLADPAFRASFSEHRQALQLGIEIARMRKEAGLTQDDLATLAGMKKQNISRLERPGYTGYTLNTLQRVAAALDADLEVSINKRRVLQEPNTSVKS